MRKGKTTLFTCLNRICNNNAYRNGFASVVHTSKRNECIFTEIVEVPRRKQAADRWLIDALNRILNTDRFSGR